MSSSVFAYQVFLVASLYWATSTFGFIGYSIAGFFWACHTFSRVGKIWLFLLQGTTLVIAAAFLWTEAAMDLEVSLLRLQIFASRNIATISFVGAGLLLIVLLLLHFWRVSDAVHEAALKFVARIDRLLSNSNEAKSVCKETFISQLGADQFASFSEKVYLKVPYSEKEMAKACGARWDASRKQWYIFAEHDDGRFDRWLT